jgi:light-regulated signal transduction histidine kinase (bacteriophytochrome)
MGALIDGILKLSRLSRGELHYVQTDLSKIARKICDELQQADSSRQVEFRIPDKVMADGDKTLLEIVLQNLLGNAWKFTAKNKEKARIEFGSEKNDNQTVYFVRDNGVGFDMRYANKLFSAFQRLHANKEFEGTGIGLATVQRIIHRHGGRVWAESEEGKGAVFFFSLGMTEERLKEEVEQ